MEALTMSIFMIFFMMLVLALPILGILIILKMIVKKAKQTVHAVIK